MKKQIHTAFNIDTLKLCYRSYAFYEHEKTYFKMIETAPTGYQNKLGLLDVCPKLPSLCVFIIKDGQSWMGNFKLKNPTKKVYCEINGNEVFIGEIKTHIEEGLILEMNNKFLYSDKLNLIYDFEKVFLLNFQSFKELHISMDCNINIGRKLKTKLQSKKIEVTRKGSHKNIQTKKGNLILGKAVSQLLKILNERERLTPTFYCEYKPSGSKTAITLTAYPKSDEIEKSKKEYIKNSLPFEGSIHRMELRLKASHVSWVIKKHETTSLELYSRLNDKSYLKFIYIDILNRFWIIKKEGMTTPLSKILGLE